jgi:hypothetical protein
MTEMKHIGLFLDQDTHDLAFDQAGNLMMATGSEAIGQHVRQRLMVFEGEWFLDREAGTPWLQQIMGKPYSPALAEAVVKAQIMGTPGVREITSFSVSFTRDVRRLNIRDIMILTIYDEEVRV